MAIQQTRPATRLQAIPTNAGGKSFAAPPKALQEDITSNDLFYVRNHWKGAPAIDIATYRLVVDGEVERPLSLSFDEVRQLAQKRFEVHFECCGNSPVPEYWAKVNRVTSAMEQVKGHGIGGNAEWAGVSLADVLALAGVKSSAVEVMFEGADHGPEEVAGDPADITYERSLPISKATHPDTLLAFEMNGEPLPPLHGFPLRLLVSGWYGMNSVKWLVGIHVLDHEFQGLYQKDRYFSSGGPDAEISKVYHTRLKVKSIITNPLPGETIPAGGYVLAGAAWTGDSEVTKVEISTDGGQTWAMADIVRPRSGYSWYRWEYKWTPKGTGNFTIMSRATNNLGETQPMEFPGRWDGIGYGNNMVFPVDVTVR